MSEPTEDLVERLLIVDDDDRAIAAIGEIERVGATVTHRFGSLIVVETTAEHGDHLFANGVSLLGFDDLDDDRRRTLDDDARYGLAALEQRSDDDYAPLHEPRVLANCVRPAPPETTAERRIGATQVRPTSARLTGSVAVNLVVVSGPTPELQYTDQERFEIVKQAVIGAIWLGTRVRPVISWRWTTRFVHIDTPADPDSTEPEELFRDPALHALGYPPGQLGISMLANDARRTQHTRWTYCALVTKYPDRKGTAPDDQWDCTVGSLSRYIVLDGNIGKFSSTMRSMTFAHETGHVFGAPDEYGLDGKRSEACDCSGWYGPYGVRNMNGEECVGGKDNQASCLMATLTKWELCEYTPYHLGFDGLKPVPPQWHE